MRMSDKIQFDSFVDSKNYVEEVTMKTEETYTLTPEEWSCVEPALQYAVACLYEPLAHNMEPRQDFMLAMFGPVVGELRDLAAAGDKTNVVCINWHEYQDLIRPAVAAYTARVRRRREEARHYDKPLYEDIPIINAMEGLVNHLDDIFYRKEGCNE